VLVIGPSLRPIAAGSILSASVPNKAAPSSLGTQRYSDAASICAVVSREDYGLAELLARLNPVPEGGLWDTFASPDASGPGEVARSWNAKAPPRPFRATVG
jgi:hypothetical protein